MLANSLIVNELASFHSWLAHDVTAGASSSRAREANPASRPAMTPTHAIHTAPFYTFAVRSDGLSSSVLGGHRKWTYNAAIRRLMLRILHVQLNLDELALNLVEIALASVSHC
jgi:hypothetical protein